MHVVQIAPPWFPIPPDGYGGIERVIHDLTEGLVAAGHRLTLLAPAGSRTSARLIPTVPEGLGLDMTLADKDRAFRESTRAAYATAATLGADIVHDHTDFVVEGAFPAPIVHTVHGPATDHHVSLYREMSQRGDRFVAISARQRQLFLATAERRFGAGEQIAFAGVVHNPTDVAATRFYPGTDKDDYVAFLGRCHWEKAPDTAIRIAIASGLRLKMALRVTVDEQAYFNAVVRPLLDEAGDLVEFVGEVGGAEKDALIGRARAVVFTSPWEEPFGLVLTEAAARGTPVVAFGRGSAPEIVRDGVTGVLCRTEAEMVAALPRAMALDPAACRAHAEARFSRDAIARRYLDLYAMVLERAAPAPSAIWAPAPPDAVAAMD